MSAFMVGNTHIDALLTAGMHLAARRQTTLRWRIPATDASTPNNRGLPLELTRDTAGRVGAMLLDQNMRSVNHRYDEEEIEEPYEFHQLPGTPDPLIVLKAVACYEYQACETPDWAFTEAYAFVRALEHFAIFALPGMDNAPGWSVYTTDIFQAAAKAATR